MTPLLGSKEESAPRVAPSVLQYAKDGGGLQEWVPDLGFLPQGEDNGITDSGLVRHLLLLTLLTAVSAAVSLRTCQQFSIAQTLTGSVWSRFCSCQQEHTFDLVVGA